MFSEWRTEETLEQKNQRLYKQKIKDLFQGKDNFMFMNSFSGELTKSHLFMDAVNDTNDQELIDLCEKEFPNNFITKKNKLEIKKVKLSGIQLSDDQQKACQCFINFMLNQQKNVFGLYGFSGTGKTTIIVEIVLHLLKTKLIRSVVFSAPTNKAVNVMKNKFEKYIRELYKVYSGKTLHEDTNFDEIIWKLYDYGIVIEFATTHKLLNFEKDHDSEGNMVFKKNKESDIGKHNLVVIDECSMLPALMVDTIFSTIRDDKRNPKVVFTGDTAQLPPVNEKNSIIFSKHHNDFPFDLYLSCFGYSKSIMKDDIENGNVFKKIKLVEFEKNYNNLMKEITNMDHFVMEQIIRSKSNSVVGVCNTIRDWTLNKTENFNIKKYIDSIDCYAYRYIKNSSKIETTWFRNFLDESKKSQDNIILTWTNDQCDKYNNAVRKNIFGKDKLDRFQVGDILMLGDYYNMKDTKQSEGNIFYTSEQIKVIDIEIGTKTIDKFPETINKKALKLANSKSYETQYKKTIENIVNNTSKGYKCWKLTVKRLSSKTDESSSVLYVLHEDNLKVHKKDCEFINSTIKKLKTTLTTKFREKTIIIEHNIIKQLWNDFHNIYSQPFANVNYGYCITTHKGQGSTFYNVYVDIHDIEKNANENEKKRCLYTALSRTSNQLHILI
jgi:Mimiviridae putative DNA helicase